MGRATIDPDKLLAAATLRRTPDPITGQPGWPADRIRKALGLSEWRYRRIVEEIEGIREDAAAVAAIR